MKPKEYYRWVRSLELSTLTDAQRLNLRMELDHFLMQRRKMKKKTVTNSVADEETDMGNPILDGLNKTSMSYGDAP